MDEIKERLSKKIKSVKEFVVAEDELSKILKRRKNWSAPGIDGVQNYWLKGLLKLRKHYVEHFNKFRVQNFIG